MKIDVSAIQYGLVTARDDLLKRDLFWHLYEQVYGKPSLPGSRLLSYALRYHVIDLHVMAFRLRELGWCVYYWRDAHGLDRVDDYNIFINYGRREGLIIGRYCANLTAWLLSHT
jgi:hypothetical protein